MNETRKERKHALLRTVRVQGEAQLEAQLPQQRGVALHVAQHRVDETGVARGGTAQQIGVRARLQTQQLPKHHPSKHGVEFGPEFNSV